MREPADRKSGGKPQCNSNYQNEKALFHRS